MRLHFAHLRLCTGFDFVAGGAFGCGYRFSFGFGLTCFLLKFAYYVARLRVSVLARLGDFDFAAGAFRFLHFAQLCFHLRTRFRAGSGFSLADCVRLGLLERFHRLLHARPRLQVMGVVASV